MSGLSNKHIEARLRILDDLEIMRKAYAKVLDDIRMVTNERDRLREALEPFAQIAEYHNQRQSTTTNTMFSAHSSYFLTALKVWKEVDEP